MKNTTNDIGGSIIINIMSGIINKKEYTGYNIVHEKELSC